MFPLLPNTSQAEHPGELPTYVYKPSSITTAENITDTTEASISLCSECTGKVPKLSSCQIITTLAVEGAPIYTETPPPLLFDLALVTVLCRLVVRVYCQTYCTKQYSIFTRSMHFPIVWCAVDIQFAACSLTTILQSTILKFSGWVSMAIGMGWRVAN